MFYVHILPNFIHKVNMFSTKFSSTFYVLDYYFGFVERLEYHSLFELPELSEPRFAAFDRFMNRESHSIGENIIDIKEFDYNSFRDALRLVFKTKGHEKHFDLMSTIGVVK